MTLQAVSFDLDGTLVDSAGEIAEAANRTLDDFGVARRPPAEIAALIGMGTRALMLRLVAQAWLERPERADRMRIDDVLARMAVHYTATVGTRAQLYPGCHAALARMSEAGLRLACVTNKEERFAHRLLESTRLAPFFDGVVGGDTLASRKPDAGPIRHVLTRLHVGADQAAHVGDSCIDVECARAAGVAAWAVPWGYNGGEPIDACRPQRIFASLADIATCAIAGQSGARRRGLPVQPVPSSA